MAALPNGWEAKWDAKSNKIFFVNHLTRSTSWEDPRPLPQGWESRRDANTGKIYFIDHLNRKTVWVDPRPPLNIQRRAPQEVKRPSPPKLVNMCLTRGTEKTHSDSYGRGYDITAGSPFKCDGFCVRSTALGKFVKLYKDGKLVSTTSSSIKFSHPGYPQQGWWKYTFPRPFTLEKGVKYSVFFWNSSQSKHWYKVGSNADRVCPGTDIKIQSRYFDNSQKSRANTYALDFLLCGFARNSALPTDKLMAAQGELGRWTGMGETTEKKEKKSAPGRKLNVRFINGDNVSNVKVPFQASDTFADLKTATLKELELTNFVADFTYIRNNSMVKSTNKLGSGGADVMIVVKQELQ